MKCPRDFSSKSTHVYSEHWHYRQILGFCNFMQAWHIKSCISITKFGFTLKLRSALKASNITKVERKSKRWRNRPKHTPMLLSSLCGYESTNLNKTCWRKKIFLLVNQPELNTNITQLSKIFQKLLFIS